MPDLTRVHLILRKTFCMFYVVKKQLTLQLKRFSGYRWHKNISSFRYLIDCWITIDCNKFNHVLFILRLQPNWETISKCQLRKQDGSWVFVVQNLGVSDFENRINYSLEVKTVCNYDQKRVVFSMPLWILYIFFPTSCTRNW